MSYNPSYGGQFQGLNAARGGLKKDTASGAAKGDPLASDLPPTKVIVKFNSLTFVSMPELKSPDRRDFFVAAVFENDDLNEVMKHKRARTRVFPGRFVGNVWNVDLKNSQMILPVADPSKRLRFYVCAISTTYVEADGKRSRDIALVGIGYSDSFFMDKCKTYQSTVLDLKPVQGGDESIKPGKLELSVECCQSSHGPAIPPDVHDSVLEAFQA
ncbi:conserved hypothetical protein [Neospora caninum Liverpool]|nr:conserved hypothetical protein [Neospora caninum Liverpool]CBZ52623.1 conserved hypothetical protein [Neospora caninum Liverpool]|eukprot:XP_003882655.1 conserved hypothetical protein [Neospora caninum Liverpool]